MRRLRAGAPRRRRQGVPAAAMPGRAAAERYLWRRNRPAAAAAVPPPPSGPAAPRRDLVGPRRLLACGLRPRTSCRGTPPERSCWVQAPQTRPPPQRHHRCLGLGGGGPQAGTCPQLQQQQRRMPLCWAIRARRRRRTARVLPLHRHMRLEWLLRRQPLLLVRRDRFLSLSAGLMRRPSRRPHRAKRPRPVTQDPHSMPAEPKPAPQRLRRQAPCVTAATS
mmetsp:Transcript_46893/g.102564  ORF Transcript_46893/g.102564 Transcript_46893/m.102564 type:complete len:221 (+) Transcript_46893:519-1181(+)